MTVRRRARGRGQLIGALVLFLGIASLPAASTAQAAISPDEFEACLLERINDDRADEGAPPLSMAYDRVDAARAWSSWMSDHEFRHMTSSERAPVLPPGTFTWGENIAWTSNSNLPDCGQVHTMFMNSSGHRANILNPSFRYAALGTHVDGSGWWVTEVFFNAHDYQGACGGTFCDDDSSVFESDIEKVAASGITKGCNPPTNNRFCPNAPVTREVMAAFIARALGLPDEPGPSFIDDDQSLFEGDIERLAAAGITSGCNPPASDRFCPTTRVTRGMMAAFLARALELPPASGVDFRDDDASIFEHDIERLAAAGITKGCNPPTNDRFCPDQIVTRGMMAAFLARALDL